MKKFLLVSLTLVLLSFLLLGAKCELISWDATNLLLTVKLTEEFIVQEDDPNYTEDNFINMIEMYEEQGVDNFDRIEDVTVQNIEIIFTENNGPDVIEFTNAYANFRKDGESIWYEIASLSDYSNTFTNILNIPFDPFSSQSETVLGTNPTNIGILEDHISTIPPGNFWVQADMQGIGAASLPADFKMELVLTLQLEIRSD